MSQAQEELLLIATIGLFWFGKQLWAHSDGRESLTIRDYSDSDSFPCHEL